MRITTFEKVVAQTSLGEALSAAPLPVVFFALVARPTNTNPVTYGGSADACLLPVDFNLPAVPNENYDLSQVYVKGATIGDGVVVVYGTKS